MWFCFKRVLDKWKEHVSVYDTGTTQYDDDEGPFFVLPTT